MLERPQPGLREIRRGPEPGELLFVDNEGSVYYAVAHGLHDDERNRTRERLLQLLGGQLNPRLTGRCSP